MNTSEIPPHNDPPAAIACPSCAAAIEPNAVLCISCGYHLKLARHLATVVDRESRTAIDPNPYASPAELDATREHGQRNAFTGDLTNAGARQAKAIVSDAEMLAGAILISLFCGLVWMLMCPWYAFRLWSWHRLNAKFSDLREPNSFSPHGELAASFQDCKVRLWVGVGVGALFWALFALGIVLSLSFKR